MAIAIERPGPAQDGSYYTMRGLKMDHLLAPLERFFHLSPRVKTIGVGDGGNEVGMGKVSEEPHASFDVGRAKSHVCEDRPSGDRRRSDAARTRTLPTQRDSR